LTPDVDIRPLGPTDRTAWEPLWQGYLSFYEAQVPDTVTELTFARLTSGSEPMGGFLAWRGDTAIGMVNWIDHRSCWTVGDYCYLQDLFAASESRGLGVGRALIEAVASRARIAGCSRVHWLTMHDNANAMLLYDRIATRSGFVQYRLIL
jgi:GNAT superfamily N-acetyltransferase